MKQDPTLWLLSLNADFSEAILSELDRTAQTEHAFGAQDLKPLSSQPEKRIVEIVQDQDLLVVDLDHLPPGAPELAESFRHQSPRAPVLGLTRGGPLPAEPELDLDLTFKLGDPSLGRLLGLYRSWASSQSALKIQVEEYKAIHRASINLTSNLDLQAVLSSILESALELIPANDAHVFLYRGGELEFGAALFHGKQQKQPFSNPRPDGITGTVARRGEKIVVNNVLEHELFRDYPWEGAIISIPLLVSGEVQGVMNIAFTEPHYFTDREQELLKLLADQAAIAIHNARLYQIAQEEIAERRQAEQALQASETRFRLLFDSSKDAIMTLVPPDWKFNSGNQALLEMFGISDREELRNLRPGDISPRFQPDGSLSQEESLQRIEKAMEQGSLFFEWTHQRLSGETFPATVLLNRVDLQGEPFLQATVRDITERKRAEEALRKSEDQLRRMVDGTQALLVNVNSQGKITYANEAAARLLGSASEDLIGRMYLRFVDPQDRDRVHSFYSRIFEEQTSNSLEFRLNASGDETRWVRFVNHPILEDGKAVGASGFALDITESMELERKAEERRFYLEGVLKSALDAIVTMDRKSLITEWNNGAENLFGYSRSETIGKNVDELIIQEKPHFVQESLELTDHVLSGKTIPPTETIRFRKDGSQVNVLLTGAPIMIDGEVVGGVATYTDITPQKDLEEAIKHMATHDSLTGLPNRRLFNDRIVLEISHAQRRGEKVAVVLLDLDLFKEVNDSLGHSTGDKLLQAVGDRLTHVLRKSDTVARMGGDEFMLILPEMNAAEDSRASLSRLLNALRKPFHVEGNQLQISASLGISFYPDDGVDVETLVKKADIAMYRAKALGGSQFQFYASENGEKNSSSA